MSEEIIIYHDTNEMKIGNKIIYDVDKDILNYIKYLEQKVEQLEKENKELNRMCELYGQSLYNADLTKAEKRVEQLENIRKEAIKLCDEMLSILYHYDDRKVWEDMKDILNKGSEE